ncbi:hypothetical protein TVAG_353770 [Trichomonas vaginalis G3]|uniref:Initiator binding domain-containing protein n=1 Tax=Trichomonas vaginalis (strain ATCC PRA-98 / G3) TaxID=412133 RepID=A2FDH0_TRIV3|nr:transcription-initiator DNA-binding domain ibd family [Trichomonas vaginalis G3]EAX97047.1 hypothetical protein TVAG_353770 [Trichomonas vaginalis G3]KAI5515723.1 transcription-initiator DNA-binding domain ibd family [Trichomonas vaginalis G3]|eukprot:XP_001309977.1 hypothetical protein [Trichomonas vaginalis G3]
MNSYVHNPHQPQFIFTPPKPIPLKPVPTAVIPKLILTPSQVPPLPPPYMVVSQSQDKFAQTDMIIKPNQIGLIPHDFWSHYKKISFENMIHTYFHRRNSSHARFVYKLYNALLITAAYPSLLPMIGVSWETNNIIKVRKTPFASLIGTRIADNSLFHKQGNFPTHGFAELTSEEAVVHNINISYIDFDEIRLVYHLNGKFTKNCGEKVLKSCIWKRNGQDL